MPELPEVETIKLFLEKNIVSKKVKSVEIINPKSFLGEAQLIVGQIIKSVERRAKVLRIQFMEYELLIHLKMSGQMILIGKEKNIGGHPTKDMFGDLPNRSTRVIFNLSDGATLYFNDQRKFGWIKLRDLNSEIGDKFLDKLGPEPLEKDFNWQELKKNLLRRKKTPIKVALLDQEIVAGVGNIYACEACFIAGIDPRTRNEDMEDSEFKRVCEGVLEALESGVKYGGSSKTHFADPVGKKGLFLEYAFVYGREELPCKKCGTLIEKIKLGGRGTFYCPKCQLKR